MPEDLDEVRSAEPMPRRNGPSRRKPSCTSDALRAPAEQRPRRCRPEPDAQPPPAIGAHLGRQHDHGVATGPAAAVTRSQYFRKCAGAMSEDTDPHINNRFRK